MSRLTPEAEQKTAESAAVKLLERHGIDFCRRLAAALNRLAVLDAAQQTPDDGEQPQRDQA